MFRDQVSYAVQYVHSIGVGLSLVVSSRVESRRNETSRPSVIDVEGGKCPCQMT